MHRLPISLKFSLVEILTLLLVGGVGFATMRTGGMMAQAALIVAMLLFIAMAIVAIVGEGAFRAAAIGFVVAAGIYGGLVFYCGADELTPEVGRLPTTQALEPLREAVTTYTYANMLTGETLTHEEALAAQAGSIPSGKPLVLSATLSPTREAFMSVAHTLIGMLLGYAGAKFAVAVRRGEGSIEETPSTPT